MANKILRFILIISIFGLFFYYLVNYKGSTYSSDSSNLEAISDEIEADKIDDYKYRNSLEGKYENNESDTAFTDNGDMVIFYVTTDTIKTRISK